MNHIKLTTNNIAQYNPNVFFAIPIGVILLYIILSVSVGILLLLLFYLNVGYSSTYLSD